MASIKQIRKIWGNSVPRFIKKASLETDMAQRIMLSVLPEVMDPLQKANILQDPKLWATDIHALRAACKGVYNLVKYGAQACVEEVGHYSSKAESEGFDDLIHKTQTAKQNAKAAVNQQNWVEALEICIKAFSDKGAWNSKFGGPAWQRIAEILLDLNNKYSAVLSARAEKDWEREVELMKQIVVLMNVFDGIAHNTAPVMAKVVNKEILDMGLTGAVAGNYRGRIQRLMDSKELRNPIDVYKEIEPVIENLPNKYLYIDWIRKFRQHSNGRTDPELVELHLLKIRAKKDLDGGINALREIVKRLKIKFEEFIDYEVNKGLNHENYLNALFEKETKLTNLVHAAIAVRDYSSSLYANFIGYYADALPKKNREAENQKIKDLERDVNAVNGAITDFRQLYNNWKIKTTSPSALPSSLSDKEVGKDIDRIVRRTANFIALVESFFAY